MGNGSSFQWTAVITCAVIAQCGTARAQESNAEVVLAKNPRFSNGSSRDLPAVLDLLAVTSYSGVLTGGTSPATGLQANWTMSFESTTEALVENVQFVSGPTASSIALGIPSSVNNLNVMFDAYFAAHPEMDLAIAWWTTGVCGSCMPGCSPSCAPDCGACGCSTDCGVCDPNCNSSYTVVLGGEPVGVMGPAGRCGTAEQISGSVVISGSPGMGDGIWGFKVNGVVTQNKVCLYAKFGGKDLHTVGHAFVEVKPTSGASAIKGFYPASGANIPYFGAIDGEFNNDASHSWDHRICWLVTTAQYNAASTYVTNAMGSVPQYRLLDVSLGGSENCTSWALGAVQAAGLPLRSATNYNVYDPEALDGTLTGFGSDLFQNCGLTESAPAPLSSGSDPFDYSPVSSLLTALDDPAAVAELLGVASQQTSLPQSQIGPGGTLKFVLEGVPSNAVMWVVDRGNGTIDFVTNDLDHAYVVPSSGSFTIKIAVFEDGSIQQFSIPLAVAAGGPSFTIVPIALDDFEAVEIKNGPFNPGDPPVLVDIASCLTDCNSNGVPDCQEGVPPFTLDCNNNGVLDACDIDQGTSTDTNQDNIPDECQNPADITGNGIVDVDDLLMVINNWGPCSDPESCAADIAPPLGNGLVDVDDLLMVINNWG
jgi:hypothetical protein